MNKDNLSRRTFIRNTSLLAAGSIAGALAKQAKVLGKTSESAIRKTPSYNPDMEYRRLGKTGLWVSVVGLGGHSRAKGELRHEIVSRCIDIGINYIDITGSGELRRDVEALGKRRDKVYLSLSETGREPRNPNYRTAKKLIGVLDEALSGAKLEYTDLWRITVYEPGGRHSFNTSCEVVAALEKAKKQGKARFIGIASHDRRWFKFMIEYFPQIEVILFPFTTMTKTAPKDSLFDALKKCDVGAFGIKPFAAGSLFTDNQQENDRRARLAIRYILHSNTVIPIPGMNSVHHADNVAKAVKERRQLDLKERADLKSVTNKMWANLSANYQWLKDWEYV